MLPYFPFQQDTFKMGMGIQALNACQIEIDVTSYRSELALKQVLLEDAHDQYFQALPATEPLQWEAIELLLPQLAQHYPQHFSLNIDAHHWHWHNRLLDQQFHFVFGERASLPHEPLDWLGRQVQEDLLLLDGTQAHTMPLVAGQLCFPNAWCLADKIGQSFLEIHHPVPLFTESLSRSSNLLLERLKTNRPVWRVNWGIKPTARLNLIPYFFPEAEQACLQITSENVGERCFLRIERQTLSRLPKTKAILFTIHTYQASISTIASNSAYARRLISVLRTTPQAVLTYKGIAPFIDVLLRYLEFDVPSGC